MADAVRIPLRSEVPQSDRWDLSRLFASEAACEEGLGEFEAMIARIARYKGSLSASAEAFAAALAFSAEFGLLSERLGIYAYLRKAEDQGDGAARSRYERFTAASTRAQAEWSWLEPEIQVLPPAFVESCIADTRFADYAVYLRKLLRLKPHILSEKEERLLALQAESAGVADDAFSVLTDVDIDFGTIDTPDGPKPLSYGSYSVFLHGQDRDLRRRAYAQFYAGFDAHKNTLAALYSGSVKLDKYRAIARNFGSAREAALFPDDVDPSVYDNLVSAVSDSLPALHEYYELRRRALKLDELRHYDVMVPLAPAAKSKHGYSEAVALVCDALAPLGTEYVGILRSGLEGGWVDRYENKGKDSGAFSYGSFSGDPHILLNFKEDLLRDVFTMAHEGGHSMHSWYSARSNPFLSYNYAIFEAEVASNFNEELLFHYLYERGGSEGERAYLLSTKIDDIVASLFRQTMFAEFERRSHEMAEAEEPLTLDALRSEYRKLQEKYFGPVMRLEAVSDLECLRIPHFYRAFYVYKYATGISAAIALSERVRKGGPREREDYFAFLRSGGSRFPIESLKVAGVDMSRPEPVRAACASFAGRVAEMKGLLKL